MQLPPRQYRRQVALVAMVSLPLLATAAWAASCLPGARPESDRVSVTPVGTGPGAVRGSAPAPGAVATGARPSGAALTGAGPTRAVPTGRAAAGTADFDRNPCAVATADELVTVLIKPFGVLAANLLEPQSAPAPVITPTGERGCGYRFVAPDSDTSDTYHLLVVRVLRQAKGGPELLNACRAAAKAAPVRYRALRLEDEACLGRGGVVSVRSGTAYYTVDAAIVPGPAVTTDLDIGLGTLTVAVADRIARRLPGSA